VNGGVRPVEQPHLSVRAARIQWGVDPCPAAYWQPITGPALASSFRVTWLVGGFTNAFDRIIDHWEIDAATLRLLRARLP
jgi:hypothetical protein